MTKRMKKRSLARMRAWQRETKVWGETGARLRKNVFSGTVLWSQTSDTEWYRGPDWDRDSTTYLRLVATWPDDGVEGWLFEPGRTLGTMTGWGTEAYFVLDEDGDRSLTDLEKAAVLAAMVEVGAPTVSEMVGAQAPWLGGIIETGCLTETEGETIRKILESGGHSTLSAE